MVKEALKRILPAKIQERLSQFVDDYLYNYSSRSYSQEGEDMILNRVFSNKSGGFYVDVGAHHPRRFSNTYSFYRKGWSGINIDAMPGSMDSFERVRARDKNIETPVSDTQEVLTYYIFNEPALNGFSKELSEVRDNHEHYRIVETIELKTNTLTEILDKNMPSHKEIDFLTVDVEGFDLRVLKSLDFDRYRPKVVLAELLNAELKNIPSDPVFTFLQEKGYIFFAKSFNTAFFMRQDFQNLS